jgi:hypothetical protein
MPARTRQDMVVESESLLRSRWIVQGEMPIDFMFTFVCFDAANDAESR